MNAEDFAFCFQQFATYTSKASFSRFNLTKYNIPTRVEIERGSGQESQFVHVGDVVSKSVEWIYVVKRLFSLPRVPFQHPNPIRILLWIEFPCYGIFFFCGSYWGT